MIKAFSLMITIALVAIVVFIFLVEKNDSRLSVRESGQNIEIRDGVQYVTIMARGGYWPATTYANKNIPTKLVIKTNGTYDCSAALIIKTLGYQKFLTHTGEEIIDLGIPEADKLQGMCSMGIYNFEINFE